MNHQCFDLVPNIVRIISTVQSTFCDFPPAPHIHLYTKKNINGLWATAPSTLRIWMCLCAHYFKSHLLSWALLTLIWVYYCCLQKSGRAWFDQNFLHLYPDNFPSYLTQYHSFYSFLSFGSVYCAEMHRASSMWNDRYFNFWKVGLQIAVSSESQERGQGLTRGDWGMLRG